MNFEQLKSVKTAKKIFGKSNIKSIESSGSLYINKHKIVVFVPLKNADELAFALASEGAGTIGNYNICSFRIKGVGTFIGNDRSKPKSGRKKKYEMVEEVRLEMVCEKEFLEKVVGKIYEVHPYEEPAYEIYDIMTGTKIANEDTVTVQLKKKIPVKNILKKLNKKLSSENLPGRLKNSKIKQAIIDYSGNRIPDFPKSKNKVLYIKKSNNLTTLEIN